MKKKHALVTRLATLSATALMIGGIATGAQAGNANNASAGNDRTMDAQYGRTLLPMGGTMGESNRWDVSYWTGVTTRTAQNPHPYGHEQGEHYAQFHHHHHMNPDNQYGFNEYYYQRGMYYPSTGKTYWGNDRGW